MKFKKFLLEIFLLILISIYAFIINYHFGFLGFNYIDSFQHIAGGKLVLEGNLPFKDYWIANSGPLMDFLQSFFFRIFDISWKSLVLNASFFNILITLNTYFFCKLLNLSNLNKITL